MKRYPTFELFLEERIRRGERLNVLEKYVVTDLGGNALKAAKFIEKRLHKTPHLAIALRVVPALTYYYHAQKNKPKHGDRARLFKRTNVKRRAVVAPDGTKRRDPVLNRGKPVRTTAP